MKVKYLLQIVIGFLFTAVFIAWERNALSLPLLDRLELIAYDARLAATVPDKTIDPRVVIIDIDERSLVEEGHWPWNRVKLAQLVSTLFDVYEIDILGFDVVFAERDSSEELELLEELATQQSDAAFLDRFQDYKPYLNPDSVFAETLLDRQVVMGYYFDKSITRSTRTGKIPDPVFAAGSPYYDMLTLQSTEVISEGGEASMREAGVTSYTANVEELQNSALGGGFYSIPSQDRDGILRRIQLLEKFEGAIYESLSLALARHYLMGELELLTALNERGEEVVESLDIGTGPIPLDTVGTAFIPYKGRAFSFRYISATDILNQTVENPEDLQYVIALVGTTAAGLVDLRNTPLQQNNYPGVEVHASTIAGLLDADFRSRPYYAATAEFLMILLVGVLLSVFLPLKGATTQTLTWLLASGSLVAVNMYLWIVENTILTIAPLLLLSTGLYMLNMAYGYFFESRNKAKLSGLFGQYIPPELVDEMAKDPESYSLEAKREQLTVLFTDVRGFTNISEGLDPKSLSSLMNDLLSPMTRIVHLNGGTIDKYMGDAMMAFWGAPVANAAHASAAVRSGLEMLAALDSLNETFKAKDWPEVKIGIGINSGEMNVGNMGSEFRMAYTVLGDAVNLGARVESLTKAYGVLFIVTEFTAQAAPEFEYRLLDKVRVKGKDQAVTILEPMGQRDTISQQDLDERDQYYQALELYWAQNFAMAIEHFARLHEQAPNRYIYQLYSNRCQDFIEHPPQEDWDGVYAFTTK